MGDERSLSGALWNDESVRSAARQDPVAHVLWIGLCRLLEAVERLTPTEDKTNE